jgi:hypothetical protein
MDQVRNFANTNRASVVNIVYVIAALVLVYYLLQYYWKSAGSEMYVMKDKKAMNAFAANENTYMINDGKGNLSMRMGAEYTINFWLYINSFAGGDKYQSVLALLDGTADGQVPLVVAMHPTKPQMVIRAGKVSSDSAADALVKITGGKMAMTDAAVSLTASDVSMPQCDVMDIDLQRWINIAVSFNGRIMDVYMDGKLARSCILPQTQTLGSVTKQLLAINPTGSSFNGYISGVHFSSYAVTPDQIYARYQSGPYTGSGNFLTYLKEKIGINITYTGAQ